ncbi:Phosphate carrier protein [Platysternon megacephalum]|uniref:Phosphate carrier protein n=1 Tax=Platysternon megacephalum TaxID=55544 RepID=A0A4D9EXN9_9SAUR|nr:Phosphate carrier protein [Platysternon megacephalum]
MLQDPFSSAWPVLQDTPPPTHQLHGCPVLQDRTLLSPWPVLQDPDWTRGPTARPLPFRAVQSSHVPYSAVWRGEGHERADSTEQGHSFCRSGVLPRFHARPSLCTPPRSKFARVTVKPHAQFSAAVSALLRALRRT